MIRAQLCVSHYCSVLVEQSSLIIHKDHCMGPALLIWTRTSFSTFTPADALLCRLLMSFVFIGGTVSGATTTALTFLFQLRRVWFQSRTWGASKNAYFYFTLLLPVLAFSTITGTFYATAYLNYWFDELVEYFGYWGYLPLSALLLECGYARYASSSHDIC